MKEPTIPEDIRSGLGIESLRFLRYSQNFVFSYEERGGAVYRGYRGGALFKHLHRAALRVSGRPLAV